MAVLLGVTKHLLDGPGYIKRSCNVDQTTLQALLFKLSSIFQFATNLSVWHIDWQFGLTVKRFTAMSAKLCAGVAIGR